MAGKGQTHLAEGTNGLSIRSSPSTPQTLRLPSRGCIRIGRRQALGLFLATELDPRISGTKVGPAKPRPRQTHHFSANTGCLATDFMTRFGWSWKRRCPILLRTHIRMSLTQNYQNRNTLLEKNLQQWAGLELNQRHTDFQSISPRASAAFTRVYKRFLGVKRGLQVVDK